MKSGILIAVMAGMTMLLRFLPFWIFKGETPEYIKYLGKVLPPAIIGMLVIYCLKDIRFEAMSFGIPEIIAGSIVVVLQVWKKNSLLSILTGTAVYMVLVQLW